MFKKKKEAATEDGSTEEKRVQESDSTKSEKEKVPDQDSEDSKAEANEDEGGTDESGTAKKSGKSLKKKPKKPKPEKPKKPKKPKTEEYVLKKNTGMRALRIVLWTMLVFVFIKGIVSIFQKEDGIDEVNAIINNFRQEFSSVKDENEELLSFAQNFGREYLTYRIGEKDDYIARIREYASNIVCNNSSLVDFRANAVCTYINAYRKEEYAAGQYDVYVYAVVEYEKQVLNEDDQTYTTEITQAEATMIVPVYAAAGRYIVEDIPLFVEDSIVEDAYTASGYSGGTSMTDSAAVEVIKTSIGNFFASYYSAEQSVINYYLNSTADKSRFTGLGGRYSFDRIDSISCFKNADGSILAVVGYVIMDAMNGAQLYQEVNVLLIEDQTSGRYYILDMNTRTKNLRMEGEVNAS